MPEYIARLNLTNTPLNEQPPEEYDSLVSYPIYQDLAMLYYCVKDLMLKDSRGALTYTIYAYNSPDHNYLPVAEFGKRGGRLTVPFSVMKRWRNDRASVASMGLKDWYKSTNVCPECKGNKCKSHTMLRGNFIPGDPCPICAGKGTYVEVPDKTTVKPREFQLVVRDHVYADGGNGYTHPDLCVESGGDIRCLKTYVELRPTYPGDAQFRIESDCKVVAIEASGSMLWLDRIPNPRKYQK